MGASHDSRYIDRRIGWYCLHLLGWLLGLAAIAPSSGQTTMAAKVTPLRRWSGLIVAPLVAVAELTLLSPRIELQDLGGVQVGGAVGGSHQASILSHPPTNCI